MSEYTFRQLIDPAMVRSLLESHQRLSGMAYGLFDADGNDIVSVGWQDICVRFHRVNPLAGELCRESDSAIMNRLREGGESFVEYRCPSGMIDAAMPIIIDGKHLATFFIGQFFYDDDPPDREFFIAQAAEMGFDRDTYLAALDRVPSFTRRHIRDNMLFLGEMVQLLTRMGSDNLRRFREMEAREERSGYQNALLNIALNRSSDAVFLIDRTLRFVFVNEAACRSLGYSREELQTLTSPDIDPDVTPEMAAAMMAGLFENGRQETFQTRHRSRDGRIFPVEISVSMFEHHGERFSLCLARDITERKRTEEVIRALNADLSATLRAIPDLLFELDEDGTYLNIWANDEELLAAEQSALLGRTIIDMLPPEAAAEGMAAIGEAAESGSSFGRIMKLTSQGGDRWFELSVSLKTDLHTSGKRFIALSRDITERKRMEEFSQRLTADLTATLQTIPDPLFEVDRNGAYLNVWARNAELLAKEREFLLGRTVADVLAPEAVEIILSAIHEADAHGLAQGKVIRIDLTDGAHWFELSAAKKAGTDGDDARFIFLSRDTTERRRMEEELHKKNTELERFTYTVSHDLKSPIITIKSFSGSIKKDLASGRHDRLEKDLGRIETAAAKMAALLDDLLKLSHAGHVINAPVPVDMAKLVDNVLNSMAGTLKETGVLVTVQPGLPTIPCDRQRMLEVVQNLIENAVKYRGDQPEPRIVIGVREDEGRQVFFVQDNGLGIDPKYHDNIFGLFNRLETKIPGTGIGLALVKRIIETHGGSVWVESDGQGNGCTFCFTVG